MSDTDTPQSQATPPGAFIVFEGPDGSGKTTMAKRATDYLRLWGLETVFTREPGGTPIGETLRGMIVGNAGYEEKVNPMTILLMFQAGRLQHLQELIYPAVLSGKFVVCDRFIDSSWVYQAKKYGLEEDLKMMQHMPHLSIVFERPDWLVYLDVDAKTSFERTESQQVKDNQYNEGGGLAAREQMVGWYKERFEQVKLQTPERAFRLDANQTEEEVWTQVKQLLNYFALEHYKKAGTIPTMYPREVIEKMMEIDPEFRESMIKEGVIK